MRKPEPVLKIEMQNILWYFEIQMDHLIPARRPDLVVINNNKNDILPSSEICRFGRPQSENKRKRNDGQILEPN